MLQCTLKLLQTVSVFLELVLVSVCQRLTRSDDLDGSKARPHVASAAVAKMGFITV